VDDSVAPVGLPGTGPGPAHGPAVRSSLCRPISGGCQGELAPGGRHEPGSGSKVRNSSDEIASARCEEIAAEVRASPGPGARRRSGSISGRQRAVALTADPARRAERVLAAAEASLQAGAFDAALGLLATVDTGALAELQRARLDLVRGHVAWASGARQPGFAAPAQRGTEARAP
jgi:hypothetical protein